MPIQSVSFGVTVPAYNDLPPFHPDIRFPESRFSETSSVLNRPYALLRQLFVSLELDLANYGSAAWNPLVSVIRPGQTVVLKPNFVASRNTGGDDLFAVVTHPSILRALVDYVFIALRGEGRIIIADAPDMSCDWDELMRSMRLDAIQEFYHARFRFNLETYDLRNFAMIDSSQTALTQNRKALPGDPAGSVIINLGKKSQFYNLSNQNYYGADFNREQTISHHQGDRQEYCVSKTILSADTLLSVPKMKVHKKVGVTLNLKGLVGMNTDKNYLLHYRLGTPVTGGDQLPDSQPGSDKRLVAFQRWTYDTLLARQSKRADSVYRSIRQVYRATLKPFVRISRDTQMLDGGNWHGNDSAWRMTADLAKILFFADSSGQLHDTPQRNMFCVVDGIVGGERLGPLEPSARRCGCLIAGSNPVAVDVTTARLMGFDPRKIKQFGPAFGQDVNFGLSSLSDVAVRFEGSTIPGSQFFSPEDRTRYFGFAPHPGWTGHLEV